jgi:hypothetical protein
MLAYNRQELENYFLVEEAKSLHSKKFIEFAQLAKIKSAFSNFKTTPNVLIRFAFFMLGNFLYSSIAGMFALILLSGISDDSYKVLLFFYAIVGLGGAEFFARDRYFRHGLDDAFILGFQLCFSIAFGALWEDVLPGIIGLVVVSLFCSIRYMHTLSVLVFCGSLLALIANLSIEKKIIGTLYLPFIAFLLAVIFYFISTKIKMGFYKNLEKVMQFFSLLLGYFSMNYMVVRELSQNLMGIEIPVGEDLPFSYLFYGFTFLIPLFYLIYALFKKDRMFLYVGLFTLGYSIFTIRWYYSLMPIEYAMLLGGIVLFALSFFAIRFLKNKTEGITFLPDRDNNNKLLQSAQVLIVSTQMQSQTPVANDAMKFGGGGFSGGGAGEGF